MGAELQLSGRAGRNFSSFVGRVDLAARGGAARAVPCAERRVERNERDTEPNSRAPYSFGVSRLWTFPDGLRCKRALPRTGPAAEAQNIRRDIPRSAES